MRLVTGFSRQVLFVLFGLTILAQTANAQDQRQQNLENQRKLLQEEIKQINKLLFSNEKQKKSVLTEFEDLSLKIDVRGRLIRVTNEQANRLTQKISVNQRIIGQQRKDLENLKKDYSEMIRKSYQSSSGQSRMMFLFSSESFLQAYKRSQYLNQYTSFRKKQGELIVEKTKILQQLNTDLVAQKLKKEELVKENKTAQQQYKNEQSSQQQLIKALKKKERSFVSQIKKKQKKAAAINKEIQRLIREAIAASNKAAWE